MNSREFLERQVLTLEERRTAVVKQLMASCRTSAIDATDRAAAAQAGVSIETARLMRVHRETEAIDERIRETLRAIDNL
jgi:hypothetical protein